MIRQRGNVFVVLLAAASMIGLISWGLYNLMAAPVAGINTINKKTLAETQITMIAELLATAAINSSNNGDCDSDNYVEPPAWRTGSGPTNGGVVPNTTGGALVDPWGSQYGYCVWDMGASSKVAGCGGAGANRLDGNNDATAGNIGANLVMVIVSGGPNATFNSTCSAYVNGTTNIFTPANDDIYKTFTYGEAAVLAAGGAGADLWYLKAGDNTTAQIAKNLDLGGSAVLVNSTGDGVFMQATADELTTIDTTGRVILTAQTTLTTCDSSNNGVIRYNNTVGTKDVQVCMLNGGASTYAWATVGTLSDQLTTCPPGGWYLRGTRDICHSDYFAVHHTAGGSDYSTFTAPTNGKARLVFSSPSTGNNSGMFRAAFHTDGTEAELTAANIGTTSLAIGRGAKASCAHCYAIGSQDSNSVAGDTVLNAARTGPRATATSLSYAIGLGAAASSVQSLAMGEAAVATSNQCQAIGLAASCSSNADNKAIGESAAVTGADSISIGYNGTATASNSVTLSPNGGASGASSASDIYIGGAGVQVIIGAGTTAATDALVVVTDQDGNGSEELKVYRDSGGNWTAISDGRLKDVLYNYDRGLEDIAHIQPKYFYFKPANPSGMSSKIMHMGLIAQEVKPWFPEAITYQENGYMSVDPSPIFIARVNAYKDLKKEHDRLQGEIKTLEIRISELEKTAVVLPPRKPAKPVLGLYLFPALLAAGAGSLFLRRRRS